MSDTKLSYLIILSLVFALLTPFTVLAESHEEAEPMETEEIESDSKVEEMDAEMIVEDPTDIGDEAKPEEVEKKMEEATKTKDMKAEPEVQGKTKVMDEAPKKDSAMPQMSEEMMKKWKKYATPGDMHKVLHSLVGDWDYELKFWHTPDSEPEITTGTTTIKEILGGRFIKQKAYGTAMGQPFEGFGVVGYNNQNKEFESIWMDNMGTGMMKSTGQYDTSMKAIVEEGTYTCSQENKEKTFRAITRFISKDKFTYELFTDDKDGNRYRAMEIVHKRRP